ncbi:hypothetical protein GCM10009689_30240 [Brevibacterium antiquum]|uniref:hypothetical protein n=1 Tax=Brevibacterium antiquum TaxID=234835 RepID=UPI0018DFB337|nr:hypothetical protein [Brevibacterium antiquum]
MDDHCSDRRRRRPAPLKPTPWLHLVLAGLAGGTILGWALEDMSLGTAYGLMGALTGGALWCYLWPFIQNALTGRRDRRKR